MRMRLFKFLLLLTITTSCFKAEEVVVQSIHTHPFKLKIRTRIWFWLLRWKCNSCYKIEQDPNKTLLPKICNVQKVPRLAMATFPTLQTLDVLTTAEGLTYDCIAELNPLLGDRSHFKTCSTQRYYFRSEQFYKQHIRIWFKRSKFYYRYSSN